MLYEAIDHVILAAPDVEAAARPFERLGFRLADEALSTWQVPGSRNLFVGGPGSLFHVEIVPASAPAPLARLLIAGENRPLAGIALRVADLSAALDQLEVRGVLAADRPLLDGAGEEFARCAILPAEDQSAVPLVLIQYDHSGQERFTRLSATGALNHALPVRRLDHLAAVAHDLEARCDFWVRVLGVPVFGEVTTPTMVIRQFRIGEAIIELLGANGPDSPIGKRPPGLISMMSLEVPDLAAAVAQARSAGFTVPDPAPGPLPGTIIATVPPGEMAGLSLQLLQYVRP